MCQTLATPAVENEELRKSKKGARMSTLAVKSGFWVLVREAPTEGVWAGKRSKKRPNSPEKRGLLPLERRFYT